MPTKLKDIPRRVYIRYGLLCLPGTAGLVLVLIIIQYWMPIPVWLWAVLIVLWIVKEAILFPFVWRSYDPAPVDESRSMIGKRGITRDRLAPIGYVLIDGELWKAEKMADGAPIGKNRRVRVRQIDGLKLFVAPDDVGDT
jgi:membrane protein implicated in regulation of membrane protease activity